MEAWVREQLDVLLESFDPHEFHGVVLNVPRDRIPVLLAEAVSQDGSLSLWELQHFIHHEHPTLRPEEVEIESFLAREWERILLDQFPFLGFVIEISPLDRVTWYQATSQAPCDDDQEFRLHSPTGSIQFSVEDCFEGGETEEEKRRKVEQGLKDWRGRLDQLRLGSDGPCEKCGSHAGFSEPVIAADHRGVRYMRCSHCGEQLIHSTKVVRTVIGHGAGGPRLGGQWQGIYRED